MKILVTGGAGYIGSHTCKCLALAGHEPVVLDNLSTGHVGSVKWGPLETGDLADKAFVSDVLARRGVEAVIHFAASCYVGESMIRPDLYFRNNVANTLNLLEAMRENGVYRLVFSSSAAVYGIPQASPITEDFPTIPVNPYGETKLMVERILGWFGQAFGMRSVSLRYFNASGADPDGEIGEAHDPETHLVPLVIAAALGRRARVKIFGRDYPTPDGTAVRDYIHVQDLARAHVMALEYLAGGGESMACNLGTQKGASVAEVVAAVARVSGREVPAVDTDRRPGDPPVLVADSALARRVLGWEPEMSGLDDILSTALAWHEKHG